MDGGEGSTLTEKSLLKSGQGINEGGGSGSMALIVLPWLIILGD